MQRGSTRGCRGWPGTPPLFCRLGRAPPGKVAEPRAQPPPSVVAVFIFSGNATTHLGLSSIGAIIFGR